MHGRSNTVFLELAQCEKFCLEKYTNLFLHAVDWIQDSLTVFHRMLQHINAVLLPSVKSQKAIFGNENFSTRSAGSSTTSYSLSIH